MFSEMIQRGAVQFFRQHGQGPSLANSRRRAWARLSGDFADLDRVGEREAVLRTLIEEFGGEAVSASLGRRLAQRVSWQEAKSDPWLRRILGELQHCGAVTLEEANQTDLIARIQPAGVSLAYDVSVLTHPGWDVRL